MTACVVSTTAWAQSPVLDGETKESTGTPTEAQLDPTLNQTAEAPVQYGVGIRFRNVRVPKSILELFVERSAGGASNFGLGVELVRRRGTVELQLGFEFENLQVGEGVWINRGENVALGDEADYIVAPERAPGGEELGWFTIEFTFVNHAVINKNFAIRYGGGAGLGILTGGLYKYDVACVGATNADPTPGCVPQQRAGTGVDADGQVEKYDLPPVFPVVNAILGVQIKPIDKLVINIEGGLRTAPFFGGTIGYFF
ncbi:MAG: hypothetical protein ACKV2T_28245 [Kofleriaceae bacterium]